MPDFYRFRAFFLPNKKLCRVYNKEDVVPISICNPEFLSTIPKEKGGVEQMKKEKPAFEWVKVETYPTIIDGRHAFETLYRKSLSLN